MNILSEDEDENELNEIKLMKRHETFISLLNKEEDLTGK